MGLILDTSILIGAEKGKIDLPRFLESFGDETAAISSITASELLHGWERAADTLTKEKRGRFVEALLTGIPIATFGLPEAREHARLWAHLSAHGTLIGPYNMLVAATALASGFTLATLNKNAFQHVPGLHLAPDPGKA